MHLGECWHKGGNSGSGKDKGPPNKGTKGGHNKGKSKEFSNAILVDKKVLEQLVNQKVAAKVNKRERGRKEADADSVVSEELNFSFEEALRASTTAAAAPGGQDTNDNDSSDDLSFYLMTFAQQNNRPTKKVKSKHYTSEVIVEIENREGEIVPIRALLDTGTSSTLLLRDFVKKGRASSYKGKQVTWKTMGGNFNTQRRALVDFKFPELDSNKKLTWICHMDDKTKSTEAAYDMIIGMDSMTKIGIHVDTDSKRVRWGEESTPLKNRGDMQDVQFMELLFHMSQETPLLQEAEARQKRILDADYSQVDIDDYVDTLDKLLSEEQSQLKQVLHSHPTHSSEADWAS
jgi:hypothetical protein